MIALLWLVAAILASPFKSKCRLEAENAALRHQVLVLRRQARGRIHLTNLDRLFLVQLYRWFPSILRVLAIVQPDDGRSLASGGFSPLLVLEVALAGRAASH
jgi:hypothetical protein